MIGTHTAVMTTPPPTILVVTKDDASRGGVASYYNLLFHRYGTQEPRIERFDIGSRAKDYYTRRQRLWRYCFQYVCDLWSFAIKLLRRNDIRVVQLSPSLIPVPLIRDGLLLVIALFLRRKTILFIRGWREDIAEFIQDSTWRRHIFRNVFGRANCVIVLAENFRDQLIRLGIPAKIIQVSRTMFDGNLLQPRRKQSDEITCFLYLARISREKGAFDIIEAAGKLKGKGLPFVITFCGHGASADTIQELDALAHMVGVQDYVQLNGFVDGVEKYRAYAEADVYLLPSHHEGCPTSILEAMGAGCYVICTSAGAMKEVVQDGVNGSIVPIGDVAMLADKMSWAIENRSIVRERGCANQISALNKFESKVIIQQFVSIYQELLA